MIDSIHPRGKNLKKEFYYTNEQMVLDLLSITPIKESESVLDAGSGENKVWYKNLRQPKFECEIEEGKDFYGWEDKVDWVVGNPPWRHDGKNQVWKWIEKASEIAERGFAFLLNHKVFNTITPVRLEKLKEKGFNIRAIRVVADKRWFGRYYYIIWEKADYNFVSWKI